MKLEGSCHCGAVTFTVHSATPYPYNRCYCAICRKTHGGGGFNVNIRAEADTLEVRGMENVIVYRSRDNHHGNYDADGFGFSRRHFCSTCGSYLWSHNSNYPEWVYPFASAIDTDLPVPPEHNHIMLAYKAAWVEVPEGPDETCYDTYPGDSIESWHRDRGLFEEG